MEERHPGNADKYDCSTLTPLNNYPLKGQKVLFLGSSVTFGAASEEQALPEYFAARCGMVVTKEAVSGTTLVDKDEESYVSRLVHNIDVKEKYSLVVCQLSTNDATQGLPMGEISSSQTPEDFDRMTITGAMEYIISYCRNHWDCPIVFYTGAHYDSPAYEKMVRRVYELAKKWGIGVLDLWNDADWNAISDEYRDLYMQDPIHPTKAGYFRWWCPELEKQLKAFLENQV